MVSVIRATGIGELGTMLAITSNKITTKRNVGSYKSRKAQHHRIRHSSHSPPWKPRILHNSISLPFSMSETMFRNHTTLQTKWYFHLFVYLYGHHKKRQMILDRKVESATWNRCPLHFLLNYILVHSCRSQVSELGYIFKLTVWFFMSRFCL
jgi:hypothetical protein